MHRHSLMLLGAVCTLIELMVSASIAEEEQKWGNLSATFIYDGEPPERTELRVDKDQSIAKLPLLDESLMVDAKSKGIANVVVWLVVDPKGKRPLVHPSYDDVAKQKVTIEARNLQVQPHVSAVWTKQTLLLKNSDPAGHNLRPRFRANWSSSILPANGESELPLKNPEIQPAPIECTIHPWMSGWVLVQDHPYFAISNANGKVIMKNLPAGKHTFAMWHETATFITEVERLGKKQKWKAGRISVDITSGENDLGEIRINPEQFK